MALHFLAYLEKGKLFGKSLKTQKLNSLLFCLRSNGLLVRAVACEARRPGFNSSSDQMFFSLLGYRGRNLMDPDMINCVILRIQVDKRKEIIPSHAS